MYIHDLTKLSDIPQRPLPTVLSDFSYTPHPHLLASDAKNATKSSSRKPQQENLRLPYPSLQKASVALSSSSNRSIIPRPPITIAPIPPIPSAFSQTHSYPQVPTKKNAIGPSSSSNPLAPYLRASNCDFVNAFRIDSTQVPEHISTSQPTQNAAPNGFSIRHLPFNSVVKLNKIFSAPEQPKVPQSTCNSAEKTTSDFSCPPGSPTKNPLFERSTIHYRIAYFAYVKNLQEKESRKKPAITNLGARKGS